MHVVGLRNGAKEFCLLMPRPCPTAGQERAKSRGKAKALADIWPGGHMANKVWRRRRSGHKAGHTRLKRAQGGRKEDTRQTHGGKFGGAA